LLRGIGVAAERLTRILTHLAGVDGSAARRLCEVAAEVTCMTGAGVMLLAQDHPQASLCTTDTVSAQIESIQYSLGEGPCVDAHRTGTAVAEPDLAAPVIARWTAFTPRALASGARAVFGYPVRIGTVRIGALNLYRDRPGPLDDDQHADALVMADVTARAILAAQAEAPRGALAADLEADSDQWAIVHQAAGMVSEQLDVSVADALVRLRVHSFRTDRLVTDVARDIVERRLHIYGDH
jgi:GAF domain